MATLEPALNERLQEVNAERRAGREASDLEAFFEQRFAVGERLAVYGSLAPGRANHHVLAPIAGRWQAGLWVHGDLFTRGWGATLGFPGLFPRLAAPEVPIELLVSSALPDHWDRLDRFEGRDYVRVLVPVFSGATLVTVANLYATQEAVRADGTTEALISDV